MELVANLYARMTTEDLTNTSDEEILNTKLKAAFLSSPQIEREKKDNAVALCYKEKGDEYVEKLAYHDAVDSYTKALRMAESDSEIIAACFHSRAAAFAKMNAYEESLMDMEHALERQLPDDTKEEIRRMRADVTANLKSRYKAKGGGGGDRREGKGPTTRSEHVELSHGENSKIPGTSVSMGIRYKAEFGRHFVARRKIRMGDVLMIQEPYMLFLSEDKQLNYCHYCIKSSMALIPCDNCVEALYCSKECRQEAYEKYHKIECVFMGCDNYTLKIIRSFLIITKQGRSLRESMDYLEELNNCKDASVCGFTGDRFIPNSARAILSLTSHEDKSERSSLSHYSAYALVLLYTYTNILQGFNMYDVNKFIYRIMCIIGMNVIMIREKSLENVLAHAIYPAFNLLNHACANNTLWYTSRNKVRVLVASKDIEPGEQIFNNYLGQNILARNARQRRQFLVEAKYFICRCDACERDYAFKLELGRLKVPATLQRRLRRNPIDIDSMWEILGHMNEVARGPCKEVELMKFAIMEAYLNTQHTGLLQLYKKLKIW